MKKVLAVALSLGLIGTTLPALPAFTTMWPMIACTLLQRSLQEMA